MSSPGRIWGLSEGSGSASRSQSPPWMGKSGLKLVNWP
jgi:hypothetical protein